MINPLFFSLYQQARHGFACACLASLLLSTAHADGMLPETSVVIIDEALGEATMKVTNTDPTEALLHVAIEHIPEDQESLLFVTPPLANVGPGKEQLVRFILTNQTPLKTERLQRVTFEGIPTQKAKEARSARVNFTIRQNLPVLIRPKGLTPEREPWKKLTWTVQDKQLTVHNDSPYVVRMSQAVTLLPETAPQAQVSLPKTYLLPGEKLTLDMDNAPATPVTGVRLFPATAYGYAADSHDAPVAHAYP